ncbi:hypothetical protein DPMN_012914 [Dreissena polymorpha]|uniref:Uncharacterized protein n=1 Tax=Dreissena polymorpha TaxID=45954 RepID=A0A9D4S3T4_DREPO|nr:hypothetical protein DPMN_012914 [Dreissena polymorpha]
MCHSRLAVMNNCVILIAIYCGHSLLAVMNDGVILRVIYCGHSRLAVMSNGGILRAIYCGHIRLTEASDITLHIRLMSERKLKRNQRKATRFIRGKLFSLWDRYIQRERESSPPDVFSETAVGGQ